MSTASASPPTDEVRQFGYQQHFRRSIHSFASFAIGFSFVSITTGIFTTYSFAINTAGPAGWWAWAFPAVGFFLVALLCAELAARIPISGLSYQWASRLTSPKLGWGFGWLTICWMIVGGVSVDYAFTTQAFEPLFGFAPSATTSAWITIAVLGAQALILVSSTGLAALINASTVATEVIAVFGLAIALILAVIFGDLGSTSNLTSTGEIPHSGYFALNGPFMLAMLLGCYTLTGFDSAANLSEETDDPTRVVPRAIWRSMLLSGTLGMAFLFALTLALPDVGQVTASAAPISFIVEQQLGVAVQKIFLVLVCASIFACGMVIMLTGSRVIFAMARDERLPGHKSFASVSSRFRTPIWATVAMLVVDVAIMAVFGGKTDTLNKLLGGGAILPGLVYAAIVALYVGVRRQIPKRDGRFNLGRWELPVLCLAIVWMVVDLVVLLFPSQFWEPLEVVFILLGIGVVLFLISLWRAPEAFRRKVGAPLLTSQEKPLDPAISAEEA